MSVLEIERGTTATFTIGPILDANDAPVNLTNAQLIFYLKNKGDESLPDETSYLVRKATANVAGGSNAQLLVTDAAAGLADVYFLPADTINLEVLSYSYRYRVHCQPAGTTDHIINSDKFRLIP